MCGIFSIIRKGNIDKNKLLKDALKCQHRGPDNTCDLFLTYNDYELYLVFHRLSINGIDEI